MNFVPAPIPAEEDFNTQPDRFPKCCCRKEWMFPVFIVVVVVVVVVVGIVVVVEKACTDDVIKTVTVNTKKNGISRIR